jgi:hypothetical protein
VLGAAARQPWEQAWQALTEWPAEEQEDLRSNITTVAVDEEGTLPIGARHFHAYDHSSTIPIVVDDLRPLAAPDRRGGHAVLVVLDVVFDLVLDRGRGRLGDRHRVLGRGGRLGPLG